jgi:hypothetical protein
MSSILLYDFQNVKNWLLLLQCFLIRFHVRLFLSVVLAKIKEEKKNVTLGAHRKRLMLHIKIMIIVIIV